MRLKHKKVEKKARVICEFCFHIICCGSFWKKKKMMDVFTVLNKTKILRVG